SWRSSSTISRHAAAGDPGDAEVLVEPQGPQEVENVVGGVDHGEIAPGGVDRIVCGQQQTDADGIDHVGLGEVDDQAPNAGAEQVAKLGSDVRNDDGDDVSTWADYGCRFILADLEFHWAS